MSGNMFVRFNNPRITGSSKIKGHEGDVEVHCDVSYEPAGRNRQWFQLLSAFEQRHGREPGLLDLGPFLADVGIFITGPPVPVQRVLYRWILGPLGTALGRRRRMIRGAEEAFGPGFHW